MPRAEQIPGRARALAAILLLCAATIHGLDSRDARAQPSRSLADILADAQRALDAGEYQQVIEQIKPMLQRGPQDDPARIAADRSDRAEAWRLYGLALFYLERYEPARIAFFEYLKLDVDARLDPSLVPPEVVAFFEDVRARNAAELRKYRPKPRRRRSWALNLVPPAGQFQNGDPKKGWLIAGVGSAALISNLTTYLVLRSWCDPDTGVCRSGGESREGQAKVLRTINLTSGAVFVGVLAYGVIDGFIGYRAPEPRVTLTWIPMPDGGHGVQVYGRF